MEQLGSEQAGISPENVSPPLPLCAVVQGISSHLRVCFFPQKDSKQPKEHLPWGTLTNGIHMAVGKQRAESVLEAHLRRGGVSHICMARQTPHSDPSGAAGGVGSAHA